MVCSVIELTLLAADLGYLGAPGLREVAYLLGAFYRAYLEGAPTYYPLQNVVMFGSYAFLHAGALHLIVNMVALYSFGGAIVRRVGQRRFLIAFALSALGGSAGFALLSASTAPMVGASGALFGLLAVWICWDYLDRRHFGEPIWVTYRALIFLILYNLVFWILLKGQLAWATHLGGFIAGWLLALYWGRSVFSKRRREARAGGVSGRK